MARILGDRDVLDRQQMEHYRDRAESYKSARSELVRTEKDFATYRDAVALLSVHAAISLMDAILCGFTKAGRSRSETHMDAVKDVAKLCSGRGLDDAGVKHLRWLVGRKSDFSYGTRRLDLENDVKAAQTKVDQAFAWAYRVFGPIGGPQQ
ncbi:MAG: hypothetical protein HYV07_14220 [Deltaproteobacteria bacterium]|nr:hypothetical protein [Deltaproteobacteria bacterium]